MRTLTITTLLLALGGPAAFAQPLSTEVLTLVDRNGDGVVTRDELVTAMNSAFAGLDADRDGALSSNEVGVWITSDQFSAADANDDGALSRAEFLAVGESDFAAADRDGDGALN